MLFPLGEATVLYRLVMFTKENRCLKGEVQDVLAGFRLTKLGTLSLSPDP